MYGLHKLAAIRRTLMQWTVSAIQAQEEWVPWSLNPLLD